METRELVVRIRLTRRQSRWFLAAAMLCAGVEDLGCESFTMTAYYPAPAGIYQRLTTTGSTVLARDGGGVGIGTTLPAGALDIRSTRGGLVLPRMTMAQADAIVTEGSLIYNTDWQIVEVRARSRWKPLGSAAIDMRFTDLQAYDAGCAAWEPMACAIACNQRCAEGVSGRVFSGGTAVREATVSSPPGASCLCMP
ncbi:MAG: hypothetical protein HY927_01480 [Elusimicrobia bacterium]|nr:hypothetical protein [Elusimicrobiota bacterium]